MSITPNFGESLAFPVVILAGGLATRLKPLTTSIPKSLIPVNGEPFILRQLRLLASRGMREIVLCVGHLGDLIERTVGDGTRWGVTVRYSWDGPHPLGTGGAVRKAANLIPNTPFFTMYGDSYLDCDYRTIADTFRRSGKLSLMTIFKNDNQGDLSNVEFLNDHIVRYDKQARTSAMRYIDYGLGCFQPNAFGYFGGSEVFDLAAVYQRLLKIDQLVAYEVEERFYEIGSFSGLQDLENKLMEEESHGVRATI